MKTFYLLGLCILVWGRISVLQGQEEEGRWRKIGLHDTTVTVIAAHPEYIFVGTEAQGIIRFDSSLTRQEVLNLSTISTDIKKIRDLKTDGDRFVFAATKYGFIFSPDTGSTWKIRNGLNSKIENPSLRTLVYQANNASTIFVGNSDGQIYKTDNSGLEWPLCGTDQPDNTVNALLIPNSDPMPQHIFAGSSAGLFKNTLECGLWELLRDEIEDKPVLSLSVSHVDPNIIYAGTFAGIFRSLNAGITWERIALGSMIIEDLIVHPFNEQVIFAASEEGAFKTTDGGETWNNLNNSFTSISHVQALAVSSDKPATLFGGTGDGLHQYINSRPEKLILEEPENNFITNDSNFVLIWQSQSDAEFDALHFIVEISTDLNFACPDTFNSSINASRFLPKLPVSGENISIHFRFSLDSLNLEDGTYYWRVTAWDGIDFSEPSDMRKFTVDTVPPNVDLKPFITEPRASGSEINIEAEIHDSVSGIVKVTLHYRRGGESEFVSENMATVEDNLYRGAIDSSFVNVEGIAYYILAEDNAANITRIPDRVELPFHTVQVRIGENGIQSPDTLLSEGESYRLVSVPLILDNPGIESVLLDDLGFYDKSRYRVIDWDAENEQYVDFAEDNRFAFVPGKGYWLIIREENQLITAGPGRTVKLNERREIRLQSGWNIIGNPFNFPVKTENLELSSGRHLNSYINFVDDNNVRGRDIKAFMPWKAYFLYVEGDADSVLYVDPGLNENTPEQTQKSPFNLWNIQIIAESNEHQDSYNFLGALADGFKPHEVNAYELPPVAKNILLYFNTLDSKKRTMPITTDYRNVNKEGEYWDFVVTNPFNSGSTNLSFKNIESVPDELDVILVDSERSMSYNLREQSQVIYHSKNSDFYKELRIIIGKWEFIERNNLKVNVNPENYALFQNYPNPFNPTTTIQFTLPEPGKISLKIYNILGHQVATLIDKEIREAGVFSVRWNAKNDHGNIVAGGVYFCALTAESYKQVRKMVLLR